MNMQEPAEQKVRLQQPTSRLSGVPIKPNLTASAVAMKHNRELPTIFSLIEISYSRLESARKTLGGSDLSDNQKIEKLATIAKKVYDELTTAIGHYQQDLIQQRAEFEVNMQKLSKPKTEVEAIQQALWTGFIVNDPKTRPLMTSDPKLAGAALELPKAIQQSIGISDETVAILREAVFPGYIQEADKYSTLIDNANRLKLSLDTDVRSLFQSTSAIRAIKQHELVTNI